MFGLLGAVVEDLTLFAFGAFRSIFSIQVAHAPVELKALGAPEMYTALPAETETHKMRALLVPEEKPEGKKERVAVVPERKIQKSTVMYTASLATALRTEPGASGDSVYTVLPYGTMVMVLDAKEGWAYVASGEFTGWAYVEDLEDRAAHVYPAFHIGEENRADDPATIRLRALINDEFGAGELDLPLQAEEYVLYKLLRRGIRIAWPPIRPRIPGTWHMILTHATGVTKSERPVVGAVVEFTGIEALEERGHVGYLEAIYPDGTIQISEANWPENGIYNERVLAEAEWKQLEPLFLVVS